MKNFLLCNLLIWTSYSFAQTDLQLVNIGDFTTTDGNVIKNCKVGYTTVGKLNSDKSNVVLWPTWFTGSSENIVSSGALYNILDTTGLYVVVADALTVGISSSPSNTPDFPKVSIRDMVNSQHDLLVNHLKIDHLYAVMSFSMGAMQTFEWSIAYPEFMDKAIPMLGTEKRLATLLATSSAAAVSISTITGVPPRSAIASACIRPKSPPPPVMTTTRSFNANLSTSRSAIFRPLPLHQWPSNV